MKRLALCCALAAACSAQTLRIGVFGLFHPTALRLIAVRGGSIEVGAGAAHFTLASGEAAQIALAGDQVECRWRGGAVRSRVVEAAPRQAAELILTVPGKLERRFRGAVEIGAAVGALAPVVLMDLEVAVASVVAAESPPGAPIEALKAQAVVTRSYCLAARRRHAGFDFCDTTHCQFLREAPAAGKAAAVAASETRGLALTWQGKPLAALYSASCGGRTRALEGAGPGEYPYFAVACPSCARGRPTECAYCTRTTGRWANRRGAGAGHGIGLCQRGAAAMAAEGAGFRAILERYYPNTAIANLP